MLRTALLWGNTINLDSDYSKYIETVSDPWVIEGFAVEGGKVKPGKAWVKVTRSNGESLFVLVQNTQDIPVSLNGDVFIGIDVAQNAIDNGLMNNEDGTGIASIKVWPQKPNQNYLLLAVWQGGRISDKREIIPKLQSISSRTTTLESKVQQTEGKVERLEDKWTPQYLGKFVVVGEAYQAGEEMFESNGKLIRRFIKLNIGDVNHYGGYWTHNVWTYTPENWENLCVEIDSAEWDSGKRWKLTFADRYWGDSWFAPSWAVVYGTIDLWESHLENIKVDMQGYKGWPICVSWHYNSTSWAIRIKGIRFVTRKSSDGVSLYPREVKGVGERVECTIVWIHNTGEVIFPKINEIGIKSAIEWTANGIRNAPANWRLEVKRESRGWGSWCKFNGSYLSWNWEKQFFIKKWPIKFQTFAPSGTVAKVTINKFIWVM